MYTTIILDFRRETLTFVGKGVAEVVRRGQKARPELAAVAGAQGWVGKQYGSLVIFRKSAVVADKKVA